MEASTTNLISNTSSSNSLAGGSSLIAGSDLLNSNSNSLSTGISFGSNSSSAPLSTGSTSVVKDDGNSYAGAPTNAFAGGGGSVAFSDPGNVAIGSDKWQLGGTIKKETFASAFSKTTDKLLSTIVKRLTNRLPASDSSNDTTGSNPFANGNNPYGTGSLPSTPALDSLNSADGGTTSTTGSNPLAGGTTSTTGSNPLAGGTTSTTGSSPLAGGTTSTGTDGTGKTPSFNILNVIFGGDSNLPFSTNTESTGSSTLSAGEILRNVQSDIRDFTSAINSDTNNPFDAGNPTPLKTPSALLNLFKADMFSFNNGINQANPDSSAITDGSNPFASIANGKPIPYDILKVALGGILPFSGSDNIFNTSDGQLPIGYGNHDLGTDNATIGNANWDYGKTNASIGNGNWNWTSSTNNATIGNGNWNWDSSHDNTTIGNGNWNWDSTSGNKTLGNGNWEFGNNNTTLGNGNWDFGTNNLVIGSGNHVFTNNSIVIGDGNWSVVIDKNSADGINVLASIDTLVQVMGIQDAINNMIGSVMGKMGQAFEGLGNLSGSGTQTFDRLILSQGTDSTSNSDPLAFSFNS